MTRLLRSVAVTCWVLSTLSPQPAVAAEGGRVAVYVGTYAGTTSKGIYRFTLDLATGVATAPVLVAETTNPSFLALHPSGRYLYAVNETGDAAVSGHVSAFAVHPATGALTLLNQQPSEGGAPCHLAIDRAGRHLLVANYAGGTLAVLPIAPDGRLGAATTVRRHEGQGPNARRQERPHAHGVHFEPRERFVVAPDLGADRLFVYRYDTATGALEPAAAGATAPGAGPRHAVFSADGRRLYAINELASTVSLFDVDSARGTLSKVEDVSTLPTGFSGENWTAEIALSPDGRFLYGSNRGHDSLAVFAVNPTDGRLTPAGHAPAGGRTPRHFAIVPGGRWLLVAQQNDDAVAVLRVDGASGLPSITGTSVRVGRPVCVLAVTVDDH